MDSDFVVNLPDSSGATQEVTTAQSLLLIGANGSGKTRLGTWIEMASPQKELVHRIPAQKSLDMPDNTTPKEINSAERDLLYGGINASWSFKSGGKYSSKPPATVLLHDYQKLMSYLFSDRIEENTKYVSASKAAATRVEPPLTKLDKVKTLWEKTLPHRELIINGLDIQTKIRGSESQAYPSSQMSDGERVIFYLIGQSLAAPEGGIVVVDEPELHLHKSVQACLWQEIEKLRPDCAFVYLTHDVDFAASMSNSKKIWLKSFDGNKWDWEPVSSIEGLPEALLVEVLGSRKPVVFVEGINGSYDVTLYRAVLNNFLVIPSGSCEQVIQKTKALKTSTQLHHLEVFGLIDRDRRVDEEIAALQDNDIYVLKVAEVENLFCTPEILSIVSSHLERNSDDDLTTVKDYIFSRLQSELDHQVTLRATSEINFQVRRFSARGSTKEALRADFQALVEGIDTDEIFDQNHSLLSDIVENRDYPNLLKFYNRKSLADQISTSLGLANGSLGEFVTRLAASNKEQGVREALLPYLGEFGAIAEAQSLG